MEFIQVAYCTSAPFLLIIAKLHYEERWKRLGSNLLTTANCLLIFYSVVLIQQLLGIYHLATQAADFFGAAQPSVPGSLRVFLIREVILIAIPFLFLLKKFRTNILLVAIVLTLMYWNHPPAVWNRYDLDVKILSYLSLFSSGYAMLWLLDMLPHQASPD